MIKINRFLASDSKWKSHWWFFHWHKHPFGIFQWTTVKLLGPIFADVVGPLMATTENGKKSWHQFPEQISRIGNCLARLRHWKGISISE